MLDIIGKRYEADMRQLQNDPSQATNQPQLVNAWVMWAGRQKSRYLESVYRA